MFEGTDVLSQIESLSRLTGLDPSEFSHVVLGEPVSVNLRLALGEVMLAQTQIGKRHALVVTSTFISVMSNNPDFPSGLFMKQYVAEPCFNGYNIAQADLVTHPFLRLDGSPFLDGTVVEPVTFTGPCLFVIPPGHFTFGLTLNNPGNNPFFVVGGVKGFLCPVEAANRLRSMRTNFLSST